MGDRNSSDIQKKILLDTEELITALDSVNRAQTKFGYRSLAFTLALCIAIFIGFLIQAYIRGQNQGMPFIHIPAIALAILCLALVVLIRKKQVSSAAMITTALLLTGVYLLALSLNKMLPIHFLPILIGLVSTIVQPSLALAICSVAYLASMAVVYGPDSALDGLVAARIAAANLLLMAVFQFVARDYERIVRTTLAVTKDLRYLTSSLSLDLKKTGEKLDQALTVDAETGLLNKPALMAKVAELLQGRKPTAPLTFFRLEIIRTDESVLRLYSERVYLNLMRDITQRLVQFAGRQGVGRLAKWEFCGLIETGANAADTTAKIQELVSDLSAMLKQSKSFPTSRICVGMASWPAHGQTPDELSHATETALIFAHEKGLHEPVMYETSMRSELDQLRRVAMSIETAIQENHFYLEFQPVVSQDGTRVEFYECLMRWCHSTLGLLRPAQFIPLAIRYGHIHALTVWSLRTAARLLKANQSAAETMRFSVNISPSFLSWCAANPEQAREIFESLEVDRSTLILEITEESFIDINEEILAFVSSLRAMGFRLSLDDFGSGYSSLSLFTQLSIDYLKIDMSLVSGVDQSEKKRKTLHTIAQLGRNIGAKVVAEGVETESEFAAVVGEQIDFIQGYWVSRPLREPKFRPQAAAA